MKTLAPGSKSTMNIEVTTARCAPSRHTLGGQLCSRACPDTQIQTRGTREQPQWRHYQETPRAAVGETTLVWEKGERESEGARKGGIGETHGRTGEPGQTQRLGTEAPRPGREPELCGGHADAGQG